MKELLNNIWNAPAAEVEQFILTSLLIIVGLFIVFALYLRHKHRQFRKRMDTTRKKWGM